MIFNKNRFIVSIHLNIIAGAVPYIKNKPIISVYFFYLFYVIAALHLEIQSIMLNMLIFTQFFVDDILIALLKYYQSFFNVFKRIVEYTTDTKIIAIEIIISTMP